VLLGCVGASAALPTREYPTVHQSGALACSLHSGVAHLVHAPAPNVPVQSGGVASGVAASRSVLGKSIGWTVSEKITHAYGHYKW